MAAASFSCSDTVVAKDALRIFPISSLNWKTRGSESVTLCMPQLHIEPKLKEVDIFVFKRLQGTLVAPSATLVRFMCEVLCSSLRPIPHTRDYDSLDMSESCRSHSQTTQTMMQCISPWQCLCLQPISERNPLATRAAETDVPTREVCVGPSPLCTPHMYESGMSVCSICNYIDCLQIYMYIYIYIYIYKKKKQRAREPDPTSEGAQAVYGTVPVPVPVPFPLAASLTNYLASQLSGQLAAWLARWLAGWMARWLATWLAGWLPAWLAGYLAGWLAGYLPASLASWLAN